MSAESRRAEIAAHILAELDGIERRQVHDVEPESDERPLVDFAWDFRMPPPGAYRCAMCRLTISRPGVCADCGEKHTLAEYSKITRAALESVPEAYRCGDADVVARATAKTAAGIPAAVKAVAQSLGSGGLMVTFVGPARTGKSTVAAAVFRAIVAAGAEAFASHRDPDPGPRRLAPMPPLEPQIVAMARGGRWIECVGLWRDGKRTEAADVATFCPFAVLDDLGQETTEPGPRADVTKEVILARVRARLPTLITTGMGQDTIAKMYGAGVKGRVFDAPAKVQRFGGR